MATTSRFPSGPNQDNTSRNATNDFQTPAFVSPLAIVTSASNTTVAPADLTGAITITAGIGSATTPPYVGDVLQFQFTSVAGETITFSTGLAVTAATLVLPAGKYAFIWFKFNGVKWVECGRAITV